MEATVPVPGNFYIWLYAKICEAPEIEHLKLRTQNLANLLG